MSSLKGSLQSISLTDVVQLLNVNRKTGKLYVINGKRSGILFVQNGQVIHAETPDTSGETAAFDVLEWEKGEFEFIGTKIQVPTSIRRSIQDLLMESARTSDSRKRLRGIFSNLHTVPWPTLPDPQLTAGLKLFAEDRKVIPFLDGYRTFMEVIAACEQSEIAVLQACLTLKEAGRLLVLEPELNLTTRVMKAGFFKKGDHVELSRNLEARWKEVGPYGRAPIENVRILWHEGPAVEAVQFVNGLPDDVIAIPKELMQAWGVPEGMFVGVRPAP